MPSTEDIPTLVLTSDNSANSVNELIKTEHTRKYDRAISCLKKMDVTDLSKSLRPRKSVHAWDSTYSLNNSINYPVTKFVNTPPVYTVGDLNKYQDDKGMETSQYRVKPKKTACQRLFKEFDNYCDRSTLHGLKYVGDNNLSVGERLFWFLAFSTAVFFAIYFILSIFTKFHDSPVIISFNPESVKLNSIPFPSITICNVNVATKMNADRINLMGSMVDKLLLSDMCNINNATSTTNTESETKVADWNYVRSFIINISQSCNDMFKLCKWEKSEISCDFNINTVLTDDGYCCAFNRLPTYYALRNPEGMSLNETYTENRVDWNPEDGFIGEVEPMTLPIAGQGAGSHLGLSLALDADIEQYYCTTTNSIGFKALLSTPIDTPKIADYGFLITPGVETRVEIIPSIKDATDGIRGIDVAKRQCFFTHERYLEYFRVYTEKNCRLECQSNFTLQTCACVPYYLPRNTGTKICPKSKEICSNKAKLLIEKYTQERISCNCLPACHEISYTKTISVGKMTTLNGSLYQELTNQNMNDDYIMKNIAVVHFFFTNDKFTKQTKSELYGFSEFLSNTGGLLGLFLGFSFLSAIEIVYFSTVRVCCKIIKKKKMNKLEKHDKSPISSVPFVE